MKGDVWNAYIDEFDYFSPEDIREGCEPRTMTPDGEIKASVVLVHGLTDSPYFMNAIGERFCAAGAKVYIPLLHMHGLTDPRSMKSVSLEEWKRNVDCAVTAASAENANVSIGGLSTGGALSLYQAYHDERVNDCIFLFSAALDVAGRFGEISEFLLRSPFGGFLDSLEGLTGSDLIGQNPYRYSRMDFGGAQQLARLINELDELEKATATTHNLSQAIFAAHSEADESAGIDGIESLFRHYGGQREFFRIKKNKDKKKDVAHASVVLRDPVKPRGDNKTVLEKANPLFEDMMDAAIAFFGQHSGSVT